MLWREKGAFSSSYLTMIITGIYVVIGPMVWKDIVDSTATSV